MRSTLLPIALLGLTPTLQAQLTAGAVPPGAIVYDVDLTLSLSQPFTDDSADIELDCDDFVDVRLLLHRGDPTIDVPHEVRFHFVDDDIELCLDMGTTFQQRPRYHAFGDLMDCEPPFSYQGNSSLVLGDHGGLLWTGPSSLDSMYIAFRRNDEYGWLLLSFQLTGNPEVRVDVHEVLPLCQGPNSIREDLEGAGPLLFPNPTNGDPIRISDAGSIEALEVFDATGRPIARFTAPIRSMAAPGVPGTYFVRAEWSDGRTSTTKLVRF